MKLIPVMINGRLHRLSERALSLLKIKEKDNGVPIELQKLPPNLEIIKIQKKEIVPKDVPKGTPVVEVKKKEGVTAGSTKEVKPKRRRNAGKVGIKK